MVGGQQIYDLGDDSVVNLESGSVSNGITLEKYSIHNHQNNKIF